MKARRWQISSAFQIRSSVDLQLSPGPGERWGGSQASSRTRVWLLLPKGVQILTHGAAEHDGVLSASTFGRAGQGRARQGEAGQGEAGQGQGTGKDTLAHLKTFL